MSRDLGPTELRVCRWVLAFLGVMVFAFLLLNAIGSLSNPSSLLRKAQIQPDIAHATGRNPKQSSQSSPPVRTVGPQSRNGAARDAVPDDPLSNMKARSEQLKAMGFEKAIRFDPRPLELRLDGKGVVPADAVRKITPAETFQPRQEGIIVTATFASAEPPSLDQPRELNPPSERLSSTTQREPKAPWPDAVSLTDEHVRQIQLRLHDLGYLSSANSGEWNARSRDALRDFKFVNRLANDDIWDFQTSEKLNSPTAIRADQSFIGNWSTAASCRTAKTTDVRLSISSRRAKSSAGSICEFRDVQWNNREWRVRANCSQGTQHWDANGKLALVANKLIWTSERDVISYFRCN
jgi:hypothetical protein